jgi:hypothetical protein
MKIPTWTLKIFISVVPIIYSFQGFSQGKFELSGGVGIPELINMKLKYGQNIQVGASAGFLPIEWFGETVVDWTVSTEISYHFAGKSKFVEQPTWYISGELSYFDLGIMEPYEGYDLAFCPRIGKTISFSKKTGINLDAGMFLPLSKSSAYSTYDFKVLFSGNICIFIRL